jgi:hypothetical protein
MSYYTKKALMRKRRGSFFVFLEIPLYADLDGFRGIFFAGYSPVKVQMSKKCVRNFIMSSFNALL